VSFKHQRHGASRVFEVKARTPRSWCCGTSLDSPGRSSAWESRLCVACTVFMTVSLFRACSLPISALGQSEVTTIEGVPSGRKLWQAGRLGSAHVPAIRLLPVPPGDIATRCQIRSGNQPTMPFIWRERGISVVCPLMCGIRAGSTTAPAHWNATFRRPRVLFVAAASRASSRSKRAAQAPLVKPNVCRRGRDIDRPCSGSVARSF